MSDHLVQALRDRQVMLFVGSGVSAHLGLPTWGELIAEMGSQLGYDPEVFDAQGGGNYLELAEFYQIKQTSIGALRSWMDRKWHVGPERVDGSRVHQAIVDLGCPLIYTTNYDRWLETAFERRGQRFVKVANVGDFTKIREDVPQIVKFHGDFDDDESLVLTETHYFKRLAFESPLDIKLRADSIGRTILFLGYSLSDINIRYMLFKLQCLWADSGYDRARPKSFIFLTKPNPIKESILELRGLTPIVSDRDDAAQGLEVFLAGLLHDAFGEAADGR